MKRQLTADEERDLLRRWQKRRDGQAMSRVIDSYMPLVAKQAAGFRKYGLPHEDLMQEGNLALVGAADRFELDRSLRFATYAVWWVRSAMQEFVLRNWSIVRLGSTRERKSLFFKLRHVQARIAGARRGRSSGRDDTLGQVAQVLRMDRDEVERMDAVLRRGDHALNAPRIEGGEEWGDAIADVRPDPETAVMEADDRRHHAEMISDALSALSERERHIIEARRLEDEPTTLRALGEKLGLSTERVRQIEFNALAKMRRRLTGGAEDALSGLPDPVALHAAPP